MLGDWLALRAWCAAAAEELAALNDLTKVADDLTMKPGLRRLWLEETRAVVSRASSIRGQ